MVRHVVRVARATVIFSQLIKPLATRKKLLHNKKSRMILLSSNQNEEKKKRRIKKEAEIEGMNGDE